MKVTVAVIDTEVYDHTLLKKANIRNLWSNTSTSKLWHGTAVCGEIYKECSEVEIDVYPVFCDIDAEADDIISILKSILESEKTYNVINMSLGIQDTTLCSSLQNICTALKNKGSIIVSAFNNDGTMTYPACLESVIGVDLSAHFTSKKGYTYISGGAVNVLGPMIQRNVLCPPNERKLVIGTSFFCAHISGIICKYISGTDGDYTFRDVENFLCKQADDVRMFENHPVMPPPIVKKTILFPYSKEILTILNLHKYTDDEIVGVYDFKVSKYCGQNINVLDGHVYKVQSIDKIKWDEFDTFVLGHIDNYTNLNFYFKNQVKLLINMCLNHGKKIYAFDDDILKLYEEEDEQLAKLNYNLYYPIINKNNFPHGQLGKLRQIPIPVICIMGTRSQQGKFTLQIKINNNLREKGYRVGLITSEPSGGLFGADYIFPYGYHKMVDVPQEEYAIYINEIAYRSYLLKRDILLFASQTGFLPRNYSNMNQCTVMQFSLLFGLSPDIVVLCVSPDDEMDHILRTIYAIESFSQAIVPCIIVNPILVKVDDNGRLKKNNLFETDHSLYNEFVFYVSKMTGKSVYTMEESNTNEIVCKILSLLEEM